MKKILSLQTIMLMSLAIGSASFMEAYGDCNKYAHKKENAEGKSDFAEDKDSMKHIEKCIRNIRHKLDEHTICKKEALEKLNRLKPRIKKIVARMKNDEQHGRIWERHEKTMNEKLEAARAYVKSHKCEKGEHKKHVVEEERE